MGEPKLDVKKTGGRALFIIILSVFFGIGVNVSLVIKYAQGQFQKGFFTEEEKSSVTFISLPQAEEFFFTQKARFIDSRSREKFRKGHIPGALNIPYEEADPASLRSISLPLGEVLVVYCDGEECRSSVHLAGRLRELGYSRVKVFFGGWKEWKEAGLPVEPPL